MVIPAELPTARMVVSLVIRRPRAQVITSVITSVNLRELARVSWPIIPHLETDFPEIEAATRLRRMFQPIVRVEDRQFREERFFVVDSTFFDVFSFPLLRGGEWEVYRVRCVVQ